jgi:hypothetical protein
MNSTISQSAINDPPELLPRVEAHDSAVVVGHGAGVEL